MNVIAVVVAGGSGRLDPLARIAGVPMVAWSVRAVLASGVTDRVMIDARGHTDALLHACGDLPVHAWDPPDASARVRTHAGRRAGGTRGDDPITASSPDVILAHDIARPLAPPGLFTSVVAAVRDGCDAAVAVLPLPDTVKLVDGDGLVLDTPDRSALRVVQTPCAFRAAVWDVHSALLAQPAALFAQAIAGDQLAFPVCTAWDLELAELLVTT